MQAQYFINSITQLSRHSKWTVNYILSLELLSQNHADNMTKQYFPETKSAVLYANSCKFSFLIVTVATVLAGSGVTHQGNQSRNSVSIPRNRVASPSTLRSKSLYDDGLKTKGGGKSSLYRSPVPDPRLPSLDPLQPTLKVGRECYDSPSIICDPDVEQATLASSSFDVPAPQKPPPELTRSNSSLKKRRKQSVLQIFLKILLQLCWILHCSTTAG